MLKRVAEKCYICPLEKEQTLSQGVNGEIAREKVPVQIWQIDYIGPLPQDKGCKFICTCADIYFRCTSDLSL